MENIKKLYNKDTIMVMAQNDYACAILECYGETTRIVFYDADYKYINDWILEEGCDCSSEVKLIVFAFEKNTVEDTLKFFSEGEPDREIRYIYLFSEYLKLQKEYASECFNRFGQNFLMYIR